MKMPKVSRCDVASCAYNTEHECHAGAITVGDGTHPRCDTFFSAPSKGGDEDNKAKVGACKVSQCRYNESFECTARNIKVGPAVDDADCLTFEQI